TGGTCPAFLSLGALATNEQLTMAHCSGSAQWQYTCAIDLSLSFIASSANRICEFSKEMPTLLDPSTSNLFVDDIFVDDVDSMT
ncbi:hypothetical protein WUBG_06199, partial [Wuchereria bancrofti]